MEPEEIIIELDEEDIKTLKQGDAMVKDTDHSDVPFVYITKWDMGKEIEDSFAEEENIKDVVFEPDIVFKDKKPVKVVK